ncbi:phenylalanyl-tRNA synthetase beta chain [Nematocida minor]|uniref:phenylalanyl-tRNA synthetase beta chain n=1 Tax=Nematocida minor TaxID=1912983 RepID=UPI00222004EA|nr:phenylalanyl-tRNA synthetase beta chain [Nematocida minor]KAI5189868.1 phenylalanyl-tRNA synthetase beta chain [Nematocida minor]
MPSISVSKAALLSGLDKQYTDEEATDVLFDFGLELDEVYTENNEVKYKIDVPANRYDLLCLRGLVYGLKAYISNTPSKTLEIQKTKETVLGPRPAARPYIKIAVLTGVDLENGGYTDLINFQDKLHQGLGLNRTLMAIGTHDYDKTTRPYSYTAMDENTIKFQPLSQNKEYTRAELDTLYKTDSKLKEYLKLSRENGTVPVVSDASGNILSLPPLINSEFSKITEKTKNILVEVTGTDLARVSTAMYLLMHHFSDKTTKIEEIDIEQECPEPSTNKILITAETVKKELILDLSAETAKKYLERMMHTVDIEKDGTEWAVNVMPSRLRPDILHQCDIIEDISIAHGYNNFKKILGDRYTVGKELPLNKLADDLRRGCSMVEYTELFTMALLSADDYHGFNVDRHIKVKNPKSTECEVLRQHMIPSVFKCLVANQHYQLPLKVFEVSDVGAFCDDDVGVKNIKKLCMGICGRTSGLEDIQEAFDVLMKRQGFSVTYEEENSAPFVKGRSCKILHKGEKIGMLGILDLNILAYHKMPYVCSFVEISLNDLIEQK